MVITFGTGTRSILTSSLNIYEMGVAVSLVHIGTTSSVLSIPPVDLMVSVLESPIIPLSPLPRLRPLFCDV